MPFFSVIIPAYNRADLLPETLASVSAQIFADWECIVVDDGSTDDTAKVMQVLCAQDSRIRYVHQQNAERSAARNNGMNHAQGTFFCFLDSDDHYVPEYLQELYAFLSSENFPVALIVSDFCFWGGKNVEPAPVPPLGGNPAEWLFRNPVSPSRACMHRDISLKYRFREDIVIVEDTVLWVSLANEFPIVHLRRPLIWYRVHDGNSVNRATKACFRRHEGLKTFFADPLSGIVPMSTKRDMLADVRFRIAEYHAIHGNKGKALGTILRSVFTQPFHMHTKAKLYFFLAEVGLLPKK
jgi:glycosyltransferase involved in cell wall biosynthesis